MQVDYISFQNRLARTEYIVNAFKHFLAGRVLDVGCDKAYLKKMLPDNDYTGVDISGDPDIQLNLEEIERLPFADSSFDCVLSSDVLEHLDNLHHVFGELIRVSRKYLIISLPNNWVNARIPIEKGKGSFGKYGLPAEQPHDRHKWFFSLMEAKGFIDGQLKKYPISLLELRVSEKPRPFFVRMFRRLHYPSQERYLNRYAHTLWVVLEKKAGYHTDVKEIGWKKTF
ncbi:MAG: class I SAM-dependent methyltransferase [Candidatus Binatia bacterium]